MEEDSQLNLSLQRVFHTMGNADGNTEWITDELSGRDCKIQAENLLVLAGDVFLEEPHGKPSKHLTTKRMSTNTGKTP